MAVDFGIFGSVDMNRGDPQNGWTRISFPYDIREITLALYYILRAAGLPAAAIIRRQGARQSVDPVDLFLRAHRRHSRRSCARLAQRCGHAGRR